MATTGRPADLAVQQLTWRDDCVRREGPHPPERGRQPGRTRSSRSHPSRPARSSATSCGQGSGSTTKFWSGRSGPSWSTSCPRSRRSRPWLPRWAAICGPSQLPGRRGPLRSHFRTEDRRPAGPPAPAGVHLPAGRGRATSPDPGGSRLVRRDHEPADQGRGRQCRVPHAKFQIGSTRLSVAGGGIHSMGSPQLYVSTNKRTKSYP